MRKFLFSNQHILLLICLWMMLFTIFFYFITTSQNIKPKNQNVFTINVRVLTDDNLQLSEVDSCISYPKPFDLHFSNKYWQVLTDFPGEFYAYSAHYDDRLSDNGSVRVLAMIGKANPPRISVVCKLWFNDSVSPVFVNATYTYGWWESWGGNVDGILQPYIVTCPVSGTRVPASVSLVLNRCDKPTTNLQVNYHRPLVKKDFAVCVKGLDFLHEDISVRLIEWIELLNILGASKIFMFELKVHTNVSKVLKHYRDRGLVELTSITLPGNQPNRPEFRHIFLQENLLHKRLFELISYNDCLYRSINIYRFVVLLDTDEVIVPTVHYHWKTVIHHMDAMSLRKWGYRKSCYNAENLYFMDDIMSGIRGEQVPSYMHMLKHVYRSKNFTARRHFSKCFHNTDDVVWSHNHFPLVCRGNRNCTSMSIPTTLARLQHYRKSCVEDISESDCHDLQTNVVLDTMLWKYKHELIKRTNVTLKKLGFFRK